jgi:hypothetical protein
MLDRSDACEHVGLWTAHETDVPRAPWRLAIYLDGRTVGETL